MEMIGDRDYLKKSVGAAPSWYGGGSFSVLKTNSSIGFRWWGIRGEEKENRKKRNEGRDGGGKAAISVIRKQALASH